MSTPTGHSRLQPLQEMQSSMVCAHRLGGERIRPELARERQAQRVGAAARQMLLVHGRAIGGAHHARLGLAAGAVVVAHLDGAAEAAPFRPVERPLPLRAAVARRVTEERAVVHLEGPHDLAGIEEPVGIETVLHLLEGADDARRRTSARGIPSARCRRHARPNASPCSPAPWRTPLRRWRASS